MNAKKVVLHFTKIDKAALILSQGQLKFGSFKGSNDYYERLLRASLWTGTPGEDFISSMSDRTAELREHMEKIKFISFRSEPNSWFTNSEGALQFGHSSPHNDAMLMWAHYAGWDGVCLLFDRTTLEREVQGKDGVSCQDIEYENSDDIRKRELSFFNADEPLTLERVTSHLKHKPDYWTYEKEWRLIDEGKNLPAAIQLGPSFLGAVFGPMHNYTKSMNDLRQPESKLFYTICQERIKQLQRTRYQLDHSGTITADVD